MVEENETTALLAEPSDNTNSDSDMENARKSNKKEKVINETSLLDNDKSNIGGITSPNAVSAVSARDKGVDVVNDDNKLKLDFHSAFSLKQEIQMNKNKNALTWQFLSALQFWLFTVPQAILTMISAILAFMATSELFDARTKIIINTIVGSASGIVVFLQTMSGVCDYGIRASMHQTTALSLRSLGDDLSLCQSGCQSTVPLKINDAFESLDSSLLIMLTDKNVFWLVNQYQSAESFVQDFVYIRAYDILTKNIVDSLFWPFHIPKTKILVNRTIEELKNELVKADSFFPEITSTLSSDSSESA
ncbi:hypothetical protein FRACYDRAFT_231938 [Fragilariopsis cylindrus CCMP1102]|uniref:Uncharacterized protein n=1 Tax=Fragilariopsis cylindrus CCMP1102 TaxID=635003 RepID=A0A1E7FUH4_9STRA|nr:hypothetical protein FRACYDRAFT_231938 [Fragilariopsis cylindrus CCMP1102]|eukprot:OEU21792.1 hypothetical protein FRACYDRAFT_231938 [Fragilariopsis cylindrus CCMP1102]